MNDHETWVREGREREVKNWVDGVAIYRLKNTNIRRTLQAKQRNKMKKL
jgi:hypothetical protein